MNMFLLHCGTEYNPRKMSDNTLLEDHIDVQFKKFIYSDI